MFIPWNQQIFIKKGHDTPRVLVCTQKTVVDQDWTPVKFLYKKSKRQQENDYT
jgi:hypothetical protein